MCSAEILGTAILIFIGCMGSIGTLGSSPPPPMQSALTFGLTVNLIIMMLGHISGAHLNPAVTIGAVILGIKSIPTGILYVIAQFIGAIIGYGMLMVVTPYMLLDDGLGKNNPFCVTLVHPEISISQAILIETLCTGCILLGASATWDPRCAHTTDSTALRFGFSVAALSFAASPYTGCSMNPARTFAPAIFQNAWENHWVYWVGPIFGALLGTYTYKILFGVPTKECKKDSFASESIDRKIHDEIL
ncbi:aquaporin-4-like isoform X2 [Leptopilina boulardi]|nr:aquaporin-4-like isoform X2 [Leptopilina boulardi]XP_051162713.1 aquaporin-4-like isoform X2 [Leptopilina boulardi]